MKKRFLSLALSAALTLSVLTPAALAAEYTEIVPPKYDEIGWERPFNSRRDYSGLIPVTLGGKIGFIDATGKEVVPPKYDYVNPFFEGFAVVMLDRKEGVIDANGKEIVPPKYDEIGYELSYNGSGTYDPVRHSFSEGLAVVRLGEWGDPTHPPKYGFIDTTGKEVVPPEYDGASASKFPGGLAAVGLGDAENRKWGFIDATGKVVIPLQYDYKDYGTPFFSEGLAAVKVDGKWGFIDTTGKMVVSPKYDNFFVPEFSEGLAAVYVDTDRKYGYIDTTGKEVVPPKYDTAEPFSEGLAVVRTGSKYGYIDATGKEVVPPKYDSAKPFSEGLAEVKVDDKYGYIDATGKEVIPCQYDVVGSISEGLVAVRVGDWEYGKWGVVDTSGKEILSPKYDGMDAFYDGLAKVHMDYRYGYIDTTGREVIPVKYDSSDIEMGINIAALRCYEGMAVVWLDEKYGCYNAAGQEILPVKYDGISQFEDGFATVTLNGASSLIDKTGKEVIPPVQGRTLRYLGNGLVKTYFNGKCGLIRVSTSAPAPTVPPSPCAVTLDGKAITLNAYLFTENGGGSNYVMLRDIAMLLNGTKAQFDVSWAADTGISITTGKAYTPVGGELQGKGEGEKGYTANSSTITVDGKPVSLGGYTIESNNYFKLRDLGTALGFTVGWDQATGTVVLSTNG